MSMAMCSGVNTAARGGAGGVFAVAGGGGACRVGGVAEAVAWGGGRCEVDCIQLFIASPIDRPGSPVGRVSDSGQPTGRSAARSAARKFLGVGVSNPHKFSRVGAIRSGGRGEYIMAVHIPKSRTMAGRVRPAVT